MELAVGSGSNGPGFGILGPLELYARAEPVPLTGARQRIVLAALLLRPNQVVPLDDLIDSLWPERPPVTAHDQVVNVISAVRRLVGVDEPAPARKWLDTRPPGYLVRVGPGQLDLQEFEERVRAAGARSAAGRPAEAAHLLRAALALWRGPALANVPAPFAAVEARRLAEVRLATTEKLVDAEFAAGRQRDLVPELTQLVAEHPLRERLRGQLMLALQAAGRTTDALAVYRAGRRLMVDEFGLEPGTELQRIERAVLTGTLVAERRDCAVATPAQLPRDVTDFTGRRAETAEIRRRLIGAAGTAVPVIAVVGPPGVGKSVLVTHVAHHLRAHFPDGQLHADLRGTRGSQDSSAVLVEALGALGVRGAAVPAPHHERVRLFRTLTAGRRMLVVLDDAADAAQVRHLLPGDPGCAVLVTSQAQLPGLEGVHRIRLAALPDDDALALLAAVAGAARVAAEPDAARRVVDLCERLPLALRVAGAKAAVRPDRSLADLADRLADPARRLDELRAGDLDVRSSLAPSVRALAPELAAVARKLAELGIGSIAIWAASAVLDKTPAETERLLEGLVEHQVIEHIGTDPLGQPRYRFPELLRLYLREGQPRDERQRPAAWHQPTALAPEKLLGA